MLLSFHESTFHELFLFALSSINEMSVIAILNSIKQSFLCFQSTQSRGKSNVGCGFVAASVRFRSTISRVVFVSFTAIEIGVN